MSKKPRIGIIGFGALGESLAAHLAAEGGDANIVGCLARSGVAGGLHAVTSVQALLDCGLDVVVECAGQQALREYGPAIVQAGVHLVPASVGALVEDSLRISLLHACDVTGAQVRMPSGAIIGIDGLAAARHAGLDNVMYRGTMPTATLKLHYDGVLPEAGLVFSGTAREAVTKFPKNANLTGTIALAGIGFDRTRVEMHVDPELNANVHELLADGAFGQFEVKISGYRISDASPSSRIVAGSLAQAALGSNFTVLQR